MEWSIFDAPEQFEDNEDQWCLWELKKFLVRALKADPNILECFYSPLVETATPLGERLLGIQDAFLSQMIFQTYNGYAMTQFRTLEQDRRSFGIVRWKHTGLITRRPTPFSSPSAGKRRAESFHDPPPQLHNIDVTQPWPLVFATKQLARQRVTRHHAWHCLGFGVQGCGIWLWF